MQQKIHKILFLFLLLMAGGAAYADGADKCGCRMQREEPGPLRPITAAKAASSISSSSAKTSQSTSPPALGSLPKKRRHSSPSFLR